jgi:PTS system beta-glucosides-specific IIC component
MSFVEKGLKKIIPNMIDIIVTPMVCIFVSSIVGLGILAPLGNYLGTFIANGLMWLYQAFGPIGAMVLAGIYPFVLSTGMQVAFTPIIMQNLNTLGFDVIYPCIACANSAMAACAIYTFFKIKDKKIKSIASSSGISALIGVTEPVLFGLVLRFRKILIATVIGAAAGGIIMGLFTVRYAGFGFVPFGTVILAFGETFVFYLLGVAVSMIVSVVTLHFMGIEDKKKAVEEE